MEGKKAAKPRFARETLQALSPRGDFPSSIKTSYESRESWPYRRGVPEWLRHRCHLQSLAGAASFGGCVAWRLASAP